MAQFSWTIVESKSASLHKALKAVEKCNHEISQTLYSSSHKTRILSQLDTFVSSLREISEKSSFNDYFEELPSLFFIKATGVVQLHPSFLGNVKHGVYSYLSNFLMHYNEDFGGVWISCGSVKPLDSLGFLTSGDFQSIVSLPVSLRVLAFVPKLDVIIVLVYGIFNVAVKHEDLPKIKHDGSSYKLYFEEKTVTENSLVTMKLISVNILTKNKSLNLSAVLESNFLTE
ncbi:uncharacterized protein TOT_020000675 [Theileria orientalis strain Shintoku]|uniref:RNA polymerase Rpb7-like N-terminal domain-containing protein n=1 Tax=Theileria orientalis strain Shintoku TaxID=869250 RepID=J4C899_THEOR|nr:uncharacterized protein TOT_020000675 [Theileria orientalis strain Shintoku]BAM40418.1 uncharacterized protein TOT_020000675 [Theileria orientalis strain Shintoku]|eukprot:XP_009690719.1 uncharacterized protein TOT_020000675 [Theileria orientalis strain Shintoku]